MSILRMKRLRVIGLAEEREALLARLIRLGCVEVSEPEHKLADPEWNQLLRRDSSSDLSEIKTQADAIHSALEALKKYGELKDGLFVKRKSIREADFLDEDALDEVMGHVNRINRCILQISQLHTRENHLNNAKASYQPWVNLDVPLETKETEHLILGLGTCPAAVDLTAFRPELEAAALTVTLEEISTDKNLHYLFYYAHRDEGEILDQKLKEISFSNVTFKGVTGTARSNLDQVEQAIGEVNRQMEEAKKEIAGMSSHREDIRIAADRIKQELSKLTVRERLLTDGYIVFFEGWVPEINANKLSETMEGFSCAWEMEEPDVEADTPPVCLSNPEWVKPINMVTEMYSMPAYTGIDPNPLMFFFFIFFFGFMFADVAYGIIIFTISLLISKKFRPKGTMGYMFSLGQYLGISTAFCGIFTGGFFGDAIVIFSKTFLGIPSDQFPGWLKAFTDGIIVNPVSDPITVLILAMAIGVVHLVFGQCIHIYMCVRDGKALEGILKVVPWWISFAGIAVLALGGGSWLFIASLVILVLTQGYSKQGFFGKLFGGVASLYDFTSWLSDILSYARLMALMLATSVIASVMNTLGAMPGNIIAFIIVFVIGHSFNVSVNLIGTYVHAARLQYLEFFGKFYEEGGVPFRPLCYDTKYVDIIDDAEYAQITKKETY